MPIEPTTINRTLQMPESEPAPGVGNDQMLTPRESEIDREEATMDLQNVSPTRTSSLSQGMLTSYR